VIYKKSGRIFRSLDFNHCLHLPSFLVLHMHVISEK